jgi:sugar (pentulose or hexulose) kinase
VIGVVSTNSKTAESPVILTLDRLRGHVEIQAAPHVSPVDVSVVEVGTLDDAQTWLNSLTTLIESADFSAGVDAGRPLIIRVSEVGMVGLDDAGNPLFPVLWAHDQRSHDDATWCRKKFEDSWWLNEVGLVPQAHHLVTKMSWLHRTEPMIWGEIHQICSLEDFVIARLLSDSSALAVSSRPDLVAQFGIWSPHTRLYSTAVLALIDGQRDWSGVLPLVHSAGSQRGLKHGYEIWS